ncbi:hypothetical protein S40288_02658 [Stachybotrys chartarum IBT 40288]|nr:hypothetical protein S40288_02658 [Stachybotrys chartarum IBT 40288]
MSSPVSPSQEGEQLRSACVELEGLALRASNSIREFVLYYPAARQEVGPLSRELADVQLAAQLLGSNSETLGRPSATLPANVSASIRALVRTGTDLVNETTEAIEHPDGTVQDRGARLQRVTEDLVDFLRRLETLRMALHLALDAVLFAVNQGNAGSDSGLPPYPGSQLQPAPSELPPYQSSQVLQTIGNLRTRLNADIDGDARADRQRPALVDFLDNVRRFMEQSSPNLLAPPIEGNAASSSPSSLHSEAIAPAIDVTNPAPRQISLSHIRKVNVNMEEIVEIVGFRRQSAHTFAVASLDPPVRFYDIRGNVVATPTGINSAPSFHMVLAGDGETWAYSRDVAYNPLKTKPTNTLKMKWPALHVSNHITGVNKHVMRWVRPLAISADATLLAVLSRDDRIVIFDLVANSPTTAIHVHVDTVVAAVFTPDNQKLVSASRDGAILVSNPRTGETVAKLDCNTHKKFFHLGVTPDSSVVVSIWGDTVNRWNWLTSDLDAYPASLRRGREGRPIALSPDCRFLACTNTEGVDISDLHTGRCLHAIRFQTGIVTAAAFSVDGTYLALGKVGLTTSRAIAKPTLDIWNLVF